jgi:hypothetical protein
VTVCCLSCVFNGTASILVSLLELGLTCIVLSCLVCTGHVLGLVGTLGSCSDGCVDSEAVDPRYGCPIAAAEFQILKPDTELTLENNGGGGTVCSHWEEDIFKTSTSSELMTGFFESDLGQPISRVSCGALEDLGFYTVDYCQCDAWPSTGSRMLQDNSESALENAAARGGRMQFPVLKATHSFNLDALMGYMGPPVVYDFPPFPVPAPIPIFTFPPFPVPAPIPTFTFPPIPTPPPGFFSFPWSTPVAPPPPPSIPLEILTITDTVIPYGNCEGSCIIDADCEFGLVCFKDLFVLVPGCTGLRPLFANFCIVPPPGQLVILENNGGDAFPLGECEGACETDSDCGPGLFCFSRDDNSIRSVPGCSGTGSPGTDYCFRSSTDRPTRSPSTTFEPTSSPSTSIPTKDPTTARPSSAPFVAGSLRKIASGPFGNCEGSCSDDIECDFGLYCFKTIPIVSDLFVPGCLGYNFGGDNFCVEPPAGTVVIEGRDGAPVSAFPLGDCEGVCASDNDCEGSLECFFRESTENVRGCEGVGSSGDSYCFNPVALTESGHHGIPANVYPLGLCEGDCDNDSECGEGLVCFKRNQLEPVPGCFGSGVFSKDYCHPGTKTVESTLPPTFPPFPVPAPISMFTFPPFPVPAPIPTFPPFFSFFF